MLQRWNAGPRASSSTSCRTSARLPSARVPLLFASCGHREALGSWRACVAACRPCAEVYADASVDAAEISDFREELSALQTQHSERRARQMTAMINTTAVRQSYSCVLMPLPASVPRVPRASSGAALAAAVLGALRFEMSRCATTGSQRTITRSMNGDLHWLERAYAGAPFCSRGDACGGLLCGCPAAKQCRLGSP